MTGTTCDLSRVLVRWFQIVPHLPPELLGYHHTPTEVWVAGNVFVSLACVVCLTVRSELLLRVQVWYTEKTGLNYKVMVVGR